MNVPAVLEVLEAALIADGDYHGEDMPMLRASDPSPNTAATAAKSLPFYVVMQYRYEGERELALDLDAWQGMNDRYKKVETGPRIDAITAKWHVLGTFQRLLPAETYVKLFRSMEKRFSNDTGKGPSYSYTRTDYVAVNKKGEIEGGSTQAVQWLTAELFKSRAPHYTGRTIAGILPRTLAFIIPDFIRQYTGSAIERMYHEMATPHDVRLTQIADGIECRLVFGQFGEHVPSRFRKLTSLEDLRAIMLILRKAVESLHFYVYDPNRAADVEDLPVLEEDEDDEEEDTTSSGGEDDDDDE